MLIIFLLEERSMKEVLDVLLPQILPEDVIDWIYYYNAFDKYYVKHNLGAMEKLFAGYVNAKLDSYLKMLEIS